MLRLTRYRIGYVGVLALVGAAAIVLVARADLRLTAIALVALILVIPGRINGYLWRDFYRGTRLVRLGRHAEAIPYLETFRSRLAQRPQLKRAIWLAWPSYTPDIEVMTLTNLGAARFGLSELAAAEADLVHATELDPQSAVSWLNLAVVRRARGDLDGAERAAAEAHRLGYRDNAVDRAQRGMGAALTRLEGRGIPGPPSPS